MAALPSSSPAPKSVLLLLTTLALGFIAGFFYTYEVSVMRGFARLPDRAFIEAMQAVNATIRNAAFAPAFFGAALLSFLSGLVFLSDPRRTLALLVGTAALLYLGGAFALTAAVNVPLNNWLADQGPAATLADPEAIRAAYEAKWVFWNLIRAINSGLAFLLMLSALWLDGRRV
ncbi:MAG: DUF1772 domain-containing protein [Proteobacteria bacterium]|nr:DUF1772 domain-containing protein [Pseudomonadota bacterium]